MTSAFSENTVAQLADGTRMVWERDAGPLKANVPTSFKFTVEEKDGSPARGLKLVHGHGGACRSRCYGFERLCSHSSCRFSIHGSAGYGTSRAYVPIRRGVCNDHGHGACQFLGFTSAQVQLPLWVPAPGGLSRLRSN